VSRYAERGATSSAAKRPLAVTRIAARALRPVSAATARVWRPAGAVAARMPLRVKLISAVLVLVAAALTLVSVISVSALRGYLLDQADQQLSAYSRTIIVRHGTGLGRVGESVGYWSELLGSNGKPIAAQSSPAAGPSVPGNGTWLTVHADEPVTVPSASGGGNWRVITQPVLYYPQGPNGPSQAGTLVVARDLSDVYRTSDRLTAIDAGVGGIALLLLAGVGIAVVRTSLRPLTEIEQTAGRIAGGQLSLRVPDRDPRTEVGSLARSLNTMLTQIENAFRARAASEASARQSEDRMRRFVADASHELRTPLTSIRGYAEYYRQRAPGSPGSEGGGLDEDELNQLMSRVEEAAARMGVLVEDLLLLARLDQQRPMDRNPVDLLALAADAVQDARVIAPDREIELNVGTGPAFLVLGDELRLRQIVGNLMSNALTHTPPGTPVEVRVRSGSLHGADGWDGDAERRGGRGHRPPPVRTRPAHPDAVIFEVADQGPGLAPEQAERVFERFYRADAARGPSTGGTGLGLAIVSALTAAHGGTASVHTAPGEGATFRITLPLAPDAADIDD
jgi:two-component system, OmpR family, sensor kinase